MKVMGIVKSDLCNTTVALAQVIFTNDTITFPFQIHKQGNQKVSAQYYMTPWFVRLI